MLILLSPARNVKPADVPGVVPSTPLFMAQALRIVQELRQHGPLELESLLDANPEMAMDLVHSYHHFDCMGAGTPALASYSGAAYRNMQVTDFTAEDFAFAQLHLRMFSALYGLLRASDGVLIHRLGLLCDVQIDGQNLYEFWGSRIYHAIFPADELVVNLASKEYMKLVSPYLTPADRVLTCEFLIQRPNGARATAATVRAARGQMARYIIKNRIAVPEALQDFDWDGYRFIPGKSSDTRYVFVRQPQQPYAEQ